MRPLLIAAVLALVAVSLYAVAWRRPNPKHELMFSLVERLAANSPELSDSAPLPRPAPREADWP